MAGMKRAIMAWCGLAFLFGCLSVGAYFAAGGAKVAPHEPGGPDLIPSPEGAAPPKSFEEAVARAKGQLTEAGRVRVRSASKRDLIEFHLGWGMYLRNEFGLWEEDSELLRACAAKKGWPRVHPDDASMMIIEAVWKSLQEE
jgi:hypothetical protein